MPFCQPAHASCTLARRSASVHLTCASRHAVLHACTPRVQAGTPFCTHAHPSCTHARCGVSMHVEVSACMSRCQHARRCVSWHTALQERHSYSNPCKLSPQTGNSQQQATGQTCGRVNGRVREQAPLTASKPQVHENGRQCIRNKRQGRGRAVTVCEQKVIALVQKGGQCLFIFLSEDETQRLTSRVAQSPVSN